MQIWQANRLVRQAWPSPALLDSHFRARNLWGPIPLISLTIISTPIRINSTANLWKNPVEPLQMKPLLMISQTQSLKALWLSYQQGTKSANHMWTTYAKTRFSFATVLLASPTASLAGTISASHPTLFQIIWWNSVNKKSNLLTKKIPVRNVLWKKSLNRCVNLDRSWTSTTSWTPPPLSPSLSPPVKTLWAKAKNRLARTPLKNLMISESRPSP